MRAYSRSLAVVAALLIAGAAWAQERHRGWLGVELQDVTKADAERLGWTAPRGAKVSRLLKGSPAAAAGLAPGDVVATLDGAAVENAKALTAALKAKDAGTVVTLGLATGGITEKTVGVTLSTWPEVYVLFEKADRLYRARKYGEALPIAEKALALGEQRFGPDDEFVGRLALWVGDIVRAKGRHPDAVPFYRRALTILEKVLGADHLDVAAVVDRLAVVTYQNRDESVAFYKRAIAMREKALGRSHLKVAAALDAFARALGLQDRYADAIPLDERALAIRTKVLGAGHPETLKTLRRLSTDFFFVARNHQEANRHAEAIALHQRRLALVEERLGQDHTDLIEVLNDFAAAYESQDSYAQAEPFRKRALAIAEKAHGTDHLKLIGHLNRLVAHYEKRKMYAEAEPLRKRALAILEKAHGPDHPDVADAVKDLAYLYEAQRRYADSKPLRLRQIAIAERRHGRDHPKAWEEIHRVALIFLRHGMTADAEALLKPVLATVERLRGPEHGDLLTPLAYLASVYEIQHLYDEAHPLRQRELAIAEKTQPGLFRVYLNNQALRYVGQGRYADAEPLFRRFVAMEEKAHGPDHPDVATPLNNLAHLLSKSNRHAEAEKLFRRALAINEKHRGPEHFDVAINLNNLAQVLRETNRLAEAERLMRRALAIEEAYRKEPLKIDNVDDLVRHNRLATRLNNLANLLVETNRLAEAESLLRRALAIREQHNESEDTIVLTNLANLLFESNRGSEAEPIMRRVLAIDEKRHGSVHVTVARSLNNLAYLLQATNRAAEAEPLFRRALAVYEKIQGPGHPDVANALNNLARLLRETDRHAEAEPLIRRALAVDEKSYGPEHPHVASSLSNLGRLLQATNRLKEAEPLHRRALAIYEKSYGPEHPRVAVSLNNLGDFLQAADRPKEAEPVMLRALKVAEKAFVPGHPTIAVIKSNLGGLYKSQGRRGEARPLLEHALAIKEKAYGPKDPRLAHDLTQLGDLYRLDGQCTRADPLFLRARAIGGSAIQEVPVLFGTDRKRKPGRPTVAFGTERADNLSFGMVVVTVPKDRASVVRARTFGKATLETGQEITQARRLAMGCIEVVNDARMIEAATRRIGAAKTYPSQVFVFVHGYNTSFEDALRRAAQIAYDIEFDGGVFLFSWPARGSWRAYLGDRNTVDLAQLHLKELLDRIVAETGASRIHFVAHSMGNMVLLDALDRIAAAKPPYAIGEIISAAPDVDRDLFERLTKSIRAAGGRFTLYASRSDWALRLSEWLWGEARAGFFRNAPLIVPGVDTIDITAAGTSLFAWNHDLYTSSPTLVADMQRIIHLGERPPDKRTSAFERLESKEGVYWRLRPSQAPVQ